MAINVYPLAAKTFHISLYQPVSPHQTDIPAPWKSWTYDLQGAGNQTFIMHSIKSRLMTLEAPPDDKVSLLRHAYDNMWPTYIDSISSCNIVEAVTVSRVRIPVQGKQAYDNWLESKGGKTRLGKVQCCRWSFHPHICISGRLGGLGMGWDQDIH